MRTTQFKKILVLGSGALKIGEAGEFDYSGAQALKALREEGIESVLINPNIATIQTSEGIADNIYLLPVTPYFVEKVIQKEQPDGLFLSFGGQTALNCGLELAEMGIPEKYNLTILGTPVQTIRLSEDRELFKEELKKIDIKTPESVPVYSVEEAVEAGRTMGFPVIIRSGYTLGGMGSQFCKDEKELRSAARKALSYSNQILVEESLKGWKEIEYEVVRDSYDNCITVCNMENVDPLGIHTGESIVVAPSQTLSNEEYHMLREISIRIVRHLGVVGECNVQFALDPDSLDYRVIEMNARLSRSSALASKATGYPLAFVAAKLALGYALNELPNQVTGVTSAMFEPALDYVVIKIPRWDLTKFTGVTREIGSSMKSVGEVMAIGRTFEEALQKGIRMLGIGMHGFVGNRELTFSNPEKELAAPTDLRMFAVAQALEEGYSIDEIYRLSKIDKWFLYRMKHIVDIKNNLEQYSSLEELPVELLREAKIRGFSDFQIARLVLKLPPEKMEEGVLTVRSHRKKAGVLPHVKQIDTLAAEFPAMTNYLYVTYSAIEDDIHLSDHDKGIIVLGSGAYRIGSSVEFDWCSVQAVTTTREKGIPAVMINCNPETVSTDYDICDRLYFEELTYERVMDIVDVEQPAGVLVSMGGQVANNLAMRLYRSGVPIPGTSPESIDRAENRHKFSATLDKLGIDQPQWKELTSMEDIRKFADEVGYPLLIRPSYVLSGAAMNVVSNHDELEYYLKEAAKVSKQYPVVVSQFIEQAKEIEIDAVADRGEVIVYAISEHIEYAGVHSGDATIVFPPQKLYFETVRRIKKITRAIAKEFQISGPFNMQFLARDNEVKVIELNLRASRSMPFVSKVLKVNLLELATRIILGEQVSAPNKSIFDLDYVGIKASQFSFSRLTKADPVLGVEMASTGEVGCLGDDYYDAILKSMLSVGFRIPEKGVLLSTGPIDSKVELLESCRQLAATGLSLYATGGTARFLADNGISVQKVYWPDDDRSPNALELLKQKDVDLVINIPKNLSRSELDNDYKIRRIAVDSNIPLLTNARLAQALIQAFTSFPMDDITIQSWNEYSVDDVGL
ncbi:MAG: carbamoyl-phosphate synthase (glutamine-hydrolyzing) large subunit [Calditrichia bacterium]